MRQKTLSGLEQQVMNIVWECNQCTVRDVLTVLNKKREIAYPTVATILRRLEKKGLVTTNKKEMTFFYRPKISKVAYSKGLTTSFLKTQVSSFGSLAMASFVESLDELPEAERKHFLELLNKHGKNK